MKPHRPFASSGMPPKRQFHPDSFENSASSLLLRACNQRDVSFRDPSGIRQATPRSTCSLHVPDSEQSSETAFPSRGRLGNQIAPHAEDQKHEPLFLPPPSARRKFEHRRSDHESDRRKGFFPTEALPQKAQPRRLPFRSPQRSPCLRGFESPHWLSPPDEGRDSRRSDHSLFRKDHDRQHNSAGKSAFLRRGCPFPRGKRQHEVLF